MKFNEFVAQLATKPIWHTISCLCPECIQGDEFWALHHHTVAWTTRPLFEEPPVAEFPMAASHH